MINELFPWSAMLMTLIAGLATGIGGAIAFFTKRTNTKMLSAALGFSSGVMAFIALSELLPEATRQLRVLVDPRWGGWIALGAFAAGMAFTALIDKLIPSVENPHEVHRVEELDVLPAERVRKQAELGRAGLLFAIVITIHNFPEGIATFAAALNNLELGMAVTVAIAMHNIPEGIAVSLPLYYATGSRKKAFCYSMLTGLAEPFGALLAWIFFGNYLNAEILQIVFAAVAGIMVYITFDELLPLARQYGEHHIALSGMIAGMLTMGVCLTIF